MKSKTVERLQKKTPKDIKIFVGWYADLVIRINELLTEKNISRKEIAERLGKQPSEISRWLNGEHNFTLRSLAKLSAELGENLLEVPERKPQTTFITACRLSERQYVPLKNINQETKTDKWQKSIQKIH